MKIEFETSSEPFGDEESTEWRDEIERILHKISQQIQNGSTEATVYDLNGARVGTWMA